LVNFFWFKAVLRVDDREDKLAKFYFVTAAILIEEYSKRQFLLSALSAILRQPENYIHGLMRN